MNPELLLRGEQTIAKGLDWLRQHHDEISKTEDLSAHYKAPYLHAVVGDPVRGRHCADLMRTRYLQSDGDFRTTRESKGWKRAPIMPANWYIYPNGWIIAGLRKLGDYGLARCGLDFVRRFQSPELGGFFSHFDPASDQVIPRYMDSSSTSAAGLAMLACGVTEEAVRAGDFMLRLLEAQPDSQRYFYTSWEIGAGLVTDVSDATKGTASSRRKPLCLSTESDALNELTWLVGKPMKFLAKLYDQTSDRRYLDGAVHLFDFFHRLSEGRWRNTGSCKVMWGSAELYRHTGVETFAETSARILDCLCQSQDPSGYWVHTAGGRTPEEQPLASSVDIAQELCAEIRDTMFDLSSMDSLN